MKPYADALMAIANVNSSIDVFDDLPCTACHPFCSQTPVSI